MAGSLVSHERIGNATQRHAGVNCCIVVVVCLATRPPLVRRSRAIRERRGERGFPAERLLLH